MLDEFIAYGKDKKKIVDNEISVDFNANSVLNVKECEIENLTLRENA